MDDFNPEAWGQAAVASVATPSTPVVPPAPAPQALREAPAESPEQWAVAAVQNYKPPTQEQVKQQSDTQRKLTSAVEDYRSKADEIWGQGSGEYWAERVPGLSAVNAISHYEKLHQAATRIKDGKPTDDDFNLVGQHLAKQEYESSHDIGRKSADLATHLPAMVGEWIATGGALPAAKKLAEHSLAKVVGSYLTRGALRTALSTNTGAAIAGQSVKPDDEGGLTPRGVPEAVGRGITQSVIQNVIFEGSGAFAPKEAGGNYLAQTGLSTVKAVGAAQGVKEAIYGLLRDGKPSEVHEILTGPDRWKALKELLPELIVFGGLEAFMHAVPKIQARRQALMKQGVKDGSPRMQEDLSALAGTLTNPKPGESPAEIMQRTAQEIAKRAAPSPEVAPSGPEAVKPTETAPAVAPAPTPGLPERRQDAARRQRVAEMSPEQLQRELLTSQVVEMPNRRAFEEAGESPIVGMSDADGLKAFNDTFGYEAGDSLLRAKAEALKAAGVEAYHEKGDEFLYRGASSTEVRAKLERARELLRDSEIVVTMKDGSIKRFKGADFSYGEGNDLSAAEQGLKAHKAEREARGERARGELRGIVEVGQEPGRGREGRTDPERLGPAEEPGITVAEKGPRQHVWDPAKESMQEYLLRDLAEAEGMADQTIAKAQGWLDRPTQEALPKVMDYLKSILEREPHTAAGRVQSEIVRASAYADKIAKEARQRGWDVASPPETSQNRVERVAEEFLRWQRSPDEQSGRALLRELATFNESEFAGVADWRRLGLEAHHSKADRLKALAGLMRSVLTGGQRPVPPRLLEAPPERATEPPRPPVGPREQSTQLEAAHLDTLRRLQDAQRREASVKDLVSKGFPKRSEYKQARSERITLQRHLAELERDLDAARVQAAEADRPKPAEPKLAGKGRRESVRLYHGTPEAFSSFNPEHAMMLAEGAEGFFFAKRRHVTKEYGDRIITLEVPRSKLLSEKEVRERFGGGPGRYQAAKEAGFEGVEYSKGVFILFDPNKRMPGLPQKPEGRRPSIANAVQFEAPAPGVETAVAEPGVTPESAPPRPGPMEQLRQRHQAGEAVSLEETFSAAQLSPQERHIVGERLKGRSQPEIAGDKELAKPDGSRYTRERIRQIEQAALKKLGLESSVTEAIHKADQAEGALRLAESGQAVSLKELTDVEGVKKKTKDWRTKLERELEEAADKILEEAERAKRQGIHPERIDAITRGLQEAPRTQAENREPKEIRGRPGEGEPAPQAAIEARAAQLIAEDAAHVRQHNTDLETARDEIGPQAKLLSLSRSEDPTSIKQFDLAVEYFKRRNHRFGDENVLWEALKKGKLKPMGREAAMERATKELQERAVAEPVKELERGDADDEFLHAGAAEEVAPGVAFSGPPFQLTMLDSLLKRGGSVTGALRRWLTSAGDLPPAAFQEKIAHEGRIAAYAQDVRNAEKDLRKAVGNYERLSEFQIKLMNKAFGGSNHALLMLPPKVQDTIQQFRSETDILSRALIQSGAVQGNLAVKVDANQGVYFTRQYQVFTDPKWEGKVDPAVVNRFKSWLTAERAAEGRSSTPEELEGAVKSLLYDGTAAENPLAFLAHSKLGSKDLAILQRRKNVPAELRALWGEYEDPLINYANSIGKMSNLLSNHLFLTRVREQGLGTFLTAEPTPENYAPIAAKGSKVMEPLNGLYTTPEIKRAFEEVFVKQEAPAWLKGYSALMGITKYAKTIGSHTTHLRNFLSNGGFALANGHWRMDKALPALKAIVDDTPAGRAYYRELLEEGVVGQGIHEGEFRAVVNDVLGRKETAAAEALHMVSDRRIARAVRSGLSLAEKAYHAEDAVWKVYAFENEKARYAAAHPNWTPEQIKKRASAIVRDTYPTYSMVPAAVKALRRFPSVSPFPSFPSEVVRTTYKTARLALAELGDPATRSIGAQRLVGLIASLGASTGLAMASRAMFGVDQEDEASMRRFMPEWEKDSPLLHMGKREDGKPRYIDLGYTDPHSYLIEPLIAFLRGETSEQAWMNAAKAAIKPFAEEELLTSKVWDVMRNRTREGRTAYNPQAPPLERAKQIGGHVGEAFVPGSVPSLRRLQMAASGTPDPKTGRVYNLQDEATASMTGQRMQSLDVAKGLEFRARDFLRSRQEAVRMMSEVARRRGLVSEQDLTTAHKSMEQARRKVYDELRADVLAAQKLGLDKKQINNALDRANVSEQDRADVIAGRYKTHQPSERMFEGVSGQGTLTPEEQRRRGGVLRKAAQGAR